MSGEKSEVDEEEEDANIPLSNLRGLCSRKGGEYFRRRSIGPLRFGGKAEQVSPVTRTITAKRKEGIQKG
jgi:hypothetical protein